MRVKIQANNLIDPEIKTDFIDEPRLIFGEGKKHISAKAGISLWGPRSISMPDRHPERVEIGIIGDGETSELAQKWIEKCTKRIKGDGTNTDFPGYNSSYGFCSSLIFPKSMQELITRHEIEEIIKRTPRKKDRFTATVNLFSEKVKLLSQKDKSPDYIVLAIPEELEKQCGSVEYRDDNIGLVHRDLRRALKAELMQYHIPTQILLKRVTNAKPNDRMVDHISKCAWNFFTGLYFKSGGIPWSPEGLTIDTCYVGISFYRPLGMGNSSKIRTSIAQAFDENGDGIILRGQDFFWNDREMGKSPHLNSDQAKELLSMVLRRYTSELKRPPRRIVVFKSSKFWEDEKDGFSDALQGINTYDLVAVTPNSQFRLIRRGNYPPLRGTLFSIGKNHYLYTTGYIPSLKTYPHGHVPVSLQLTDIHGDSTISTLSKEVLTLTKLNWNSAAFAGLMPITLTFSKLVGDIMKEIPDEKEPMPQFKYYM